jgi:hypothetical protein
MAAPWAIFRTADQTSPERIKVNVTNQLEKISIFVTDNGFVASLKDMSYSVIFLVEIRGI